MHDEMSNIADYPPFIWERLSATIGEGDAWSDLRATCQKAAAITAAYLERDVFAVLDEPPHSITQGDISRNLAVLRGTHVDRILDETHRKIKMLLLRTMMRTRSRPA